MNMRKNVNKIVAFAIGISIISGSIIPAFAADNTLNTNKTTANVQTQVNGKPLLTLKDAIEAGIANNSQIVLQSKKINLEEDKLDIQDEIDDDGYDYDNQELVVKQEKQKKDFMEDQVAQDITDKYNELVSQSKSLDKINKQIEIKTKEVSDAKLKKSLGLATSIDMTQAQIDIQTLKNSQENAEKKLKNSQDYFQVLTGKELTKYTLSQDTTYEVFRIDGSVDEYLDNTIDKFVEYDKESYDLFKDHVKDDLKTTLPTSLPDRSDPIFSNDPTDGTVTNPKTGDEKYEAAIEGYEAYLNAKYGVDGKYVALSEEKKAYKQLLNAYYTTLLSLENNINVLKANMELTNKKLSNMKLKYDLGLVTKTDYENQILTSYDQEINLRSLVDNYNKIKNNIQKPWTISTSSGSSAQ
ncbi:TolC family protein [Clostridium chromiireducens]|uniref:TolC family protein n=2 Tax=Clostridium chromiireducens TaxID=225345 RepID=A0A964RJG7_9CLOT|nr:TolC family protein [Clostridium chromiireducens]